MFIKLLIYGFFVGIFGIIPGISGSFLLIVFNIYELTLNKINNLFHDFKDSFKFLLLLGIGIIIGTIIFAKIIEFLINYYNTTSRICLFFLILSTIPSIVKKYKFNYKCILCFFTFLIIGIIFSNSFIFSSLKINFFTNVLTGVIVCFASIVPGISSTVILNILGLYNNYINAIANINICVLLQIGVGFIITSFIIAKVIKYLLKNFYDYTYSAIIGLSLSTLPAIFFFKYGSFFEIFTGIGIGMILFLMNYFFIGKL